MSYISTAPQKDANYDIALTMLTHYGKLKNLSLTEIADLCYVSKASISRFCRFMGFDGFRELQDCLLQDFSIGTDYSKAFFDKLCAAPQAALQDYSEELIRNIRVTTTPENTARLTDMAMAIANSERIAFFSHHFLWDIGRHLQSKMIRMDRYVELYMDYAQQLACARSLHKNDLAIVCTVGGSYPLRYPTIWNGLVAAECPICPLCAGLRSVQSQRRG
jgi:DNA-binding MurR/RpiR family transcriptional regulator